MTECNPVVEAKVEAAVVLAEKSVGAVLLEATLAECKALEKPWHAMSEQRQNELIERLRSQVETAARAAVRAICSVGFKHVGATLESLTIKDGAKAVLTLLRGNEIHDVADAVDSRVVLVFADPTDFTGGMHLIKGEEDQPQLPLEDAA